MQNEVYKNESHLAEADDDHGRPAIAVSHALIAYLTIWGLGILASLGVL
jgi:hypothetical protein